MIIFPAIDIQNGNVVRLKQGKFDCVTEYGKDPAAVAAHWEKLGAEWLHVVDLDGAKTGTLTNWDSIAAILKKVTIPIEVGGGIRSEKDISRLIDMGVSRIILGTKAINQPNFLKKVLGRWPDQMAVSIDASNGLVTKLGWTERTDIKAVDFAKELQGFGLKYLIFTDIARDGMLTGPNFKRLEEILNAVTIPVIASGGVSNVADIKKLAKYQGKGLLGVITGKALYEGTLDLVEALKTVNC